MPPVRLALNAAPVETTGLSLDQSNKGHLGQKHAEYSFTQM